MKRTGYYVTRLGPPHYGNDSGDIGGTFKSEDAALAFARAHVRGAPLGIYRVHSRRTRRDQVRVVYPEKARVAGPSVQRVTTPQHATRKTPPAQLNREIAEALAPKDEVELTPLRAIQIMETAPNEAVAREILAGQREQVGYLGGRILPPSPAKLGWRVQVFIEDDGGVESDWLPHGMRRVIVPAGMRSTLGI